MAPKASYAQKSPTIAQRVSSKQHKNKMVHHLSKVKDIEFSITQANHSTVHQGNPHRYHHLKTHRNMETWHPPRYMMKQLISKEILVTKQANHRQNEQTVAVPAQITAATTGTTDQETRDTQISRKPIQLSHNHKDCKIPQNHAHLHLS